MKYKHPLSMYLSYIYLDKLWAKIICCVVSDMFHFHISWWRLYCKGEMFMHRICKRGNSIPYISAILQYHSNKFTAIHSMVTCKFYELINALNYRIKWDYSKTYLQIKEFLQKRNNFWHVNVESCISISILTSAKPEINIFHSQLLNFMTL